MRCLSIRSNKKTLKYREVVAEDSIDLYKLILESVYTVDVCRELISF